MNNEDIRNLLERIKDNRVSVDEALNLIKHMPYEDLTFAKIDHHRQIRNGIAEVVYAEGKREEEVIEISRRIYEKHQRLLVTRANRRIFDNLDIQAARYHSHSRTIEAGSPQEKTGNVVVVTAGTSDIPVAEEVIVTLSFLGSKTEMLYDVGVAGLHRLLGNIKVFEKANVVVVVAGMEGALPSVIGGITDKPLIAVPTSIGYGTNLGGLTPLFAMLNSCAPGISVVNIDNGFGAGVAAHKINKPI